MALFDLLGVGASGAADRRPWLRHGAWPEGVFPLRRDFDAAARLPLDDQESAAAANAGLRNKVYTP